ncbi:hypothetical protein Csa_002140 [Cucumis sativus]|uniref:Uncharacterized protein n=1 Tax=Cucumis sativus TaxID=3659 RepID=A0A0A0LCD3_CUCSA|nr:hypothetical protein Csa_002140 [Cucumis sativus]
MNQSSMNSDPKSVNDKHKNNQDHNPPPKGLKMKQKVTEDHNYQPAKDSKMNQKIDDDDDDDVYRDLFSLYPRYFEEQFNIENIGSFVQVGFEERRDQRDDDYRGESSKRKRITKSPELELIDLNSDSSSSEPVKLIEEIVKIYSDYIEHVFQMMKDRFNDEQRWNFDKTKCSDLAEIFVQKMKRLGIELIEMKKDPNQRENYRVIKPRVLQITNQLEKMHDRFDSSQNIRASAKRACTRNELILCINEIDEMMKELYGITLRIEELKALEMKNKTMEIRQRNLRI